MRIFFIDAAPRADPRDRGRPIDRSCGGSAGSAVRREMAAAARARRAGPTRRRSSFRNRNRGYKADVHIRHLTPLDMEDLVPCGSYRLSGPRGRAQAAPTEASRRAEVAHDDTGCAQPRGEKLITRQHPRAQHDVSERTHARARQPIGMAQ